MRTDKVSRAFVYALIGAFMLTLLFVEACGLASWLADVRPELSDVPAEHINLGCAGIAVLAAILVVVMWFFRTELHEWLRRPRSRTFEYWHYLQLQCRVHEKYSEYALGSNWTESQKRVSKVLLELDDAVLESDLTLLLWMDNFIQVVHAGGNRVNFPRQELAALLVGAGFRPVSKMQGSFEDLATFTNQWIGFVVHHLEKGFDLPTPPSGRASTLCILTWSN